MHFVYVKATQDVGYRDCRFADYWRELGNLQSSTAPLRGSYHFLTATSAGSAQAESYVKLRMQNGGFDKRELPSVLDLEWDKTDTVRDRWVNKAPTEIMASAKQWLDFVEQKTGRRPFIYTANSWLQERKITKAQVASLKAAVWVADYSPTRRAIEKPEQPGGFPWTLWQFTDASELALAPGVKFDANIFKGLPADFDRQMGLVSP